MNIKPFSLIDDDENSSQTHFSSKDKKNSKDEEEDNNNINNKKSNFPGKNILNLDTAKKENDLKNMEINNQQKVINNFRAKINKEMNRGKLFQIDLKNKIISQNNKNNKNDISIPTKEEKDKQDIADMIKNEEKTDKLSKNLLNDKKQKRNSYHGKIYFYIAVSMLLYQYLSYVYLIEIPIIQSKYIYNYKFIYFI